MNKWRSVLLASLALVMFVPAGYANPLVAAPFDSLYNIFDLGPVVGVPGPFGGLNFLAGDPNTLLLGGTANTAQGLFYQVPVNRDINGHITGFGAATPWGTAGAYNDGGVVYGPGGVLFYARWPVNEVGEVKPGSTGDDKVVDVTPLGIAAATAAMSFVPAGFGGAGRFKVSSWEGGEFYDVTLAPDGFGTFDLTGAVQTATLGGGPEGFIYVPHGSPLFSGDNLLMSEFSDGNVAAYAVDANGDPIAGSRVDFISGLTQAEGALVDPVTGDFLFSTFGTASDRIFEVQGFVPPPPTVPEPGTLVLLGLGLATLGMKGYRSRDGRKH